MPIDAPKLHLNEHLSPRLAIQLRNHGFNVTTSQEMNMLTTSDEEQLAFAASEQRAIVTFNVRDFSRLRTESLNQGKEHWGIIFSTEESISVLFRKLLRLLNTVSTNELKMN
jgi:hypothetical protein